MYVCYVPAAPDPPADPPLVTSRRRVARCKFGAPLLLVPPPAQGALIAAERRRARPFLAPIRRLASLTGVDRSTLLSPVLGAGYWRTRWVRESLVWCPLSPATAVVGGGGGD